MNTPPKVSPIARAAFLICTERNITDFCIDDTKIIMEIYDRYVALYPNSPHAAENRRKASVSSSLLNSTYFRVEKERRPDGTWGKYHRYRYFLSADGSGGRGADTWRRTDPDTSYIMRCVEIYRLAHNIETVRTSNPDHMLGIWQLVHDTWEPSRLELTRRQACQEIATHIREQK